MKPNYPFAEITRRSVVMAGLGALIARPGLAYAQEEESLASEAKAKGPVVWYAGAIITEADVAAVKEAFEKKYSGLELIIEKASAGVMFQRLMQDVKAGVKRADAFSSGDLGHFRDLRLQNALATYTPSALKDTREICAQTSLPDVTYIHFNMLLMACRTDMGDAEPKNWTDVLDPKLKGRSAVGHPAYSGTVGRWALAMSQNYGLDFFNKLSANNPLVGRSIVEAASSIAAGEREVAAVTSPDSFMAQVRNGAKIKGVLPSDGGVFVPTGTSVMSNANNPAGGRLMLNFLCSKEFSEHQAKKTSFVSNASVKMSPLFEEIFGGKLLKVDDARGDAEMPKVLERWREVFGA